jgi:hypothetical protein
MKRNRSKISNATHVRAPRQFIVFHDSLGRTKARFVSIVARRSPQPAAQHPPPAAHSAGPDLQSDETLDHLHLDIATRHLQDGGEFTTTTNVRRGERCHRCSVFAPAQENPLKVACSRDFPVRKHRADDCRFDVGREGQGYPINASKKAVSDQRLGDPHLKLPPTGVRLRTCLDSKLRTFASRGKT